MTGLGTRAVATSNRLGKEVVGHIEVALGRTRRELRRRPREFGAVDPLALRARLIFVVGAFILEDGVGNAAALAR